jgi:hypothetical protein
VFCCVVTKRFLLLYPAQAREMMPQLVRLFIVCVLFVWHPFVPCQAIRLGARADPLDMTGLGGEFGVSSTGSASGATGATGSSESGGTGSSYAEDLKRSVRLANPLLSGKELMRLGEAQLKLETEKRFLAVSAEEGKESKDLYVKTLRDFFEKEIVDMSAKELSRELTRRRIVPTSAGIAALRDQVRAQLKMPQQFPAGVTWHPSFDTPNANNSCPVTHDCAVCTAAPGCGFMSNLRLCLAGNHVGPSRRSLRLKLEDLTNKQVVAQFWVYGSCPAAPCSTYSNCRSCLADKFCGWCAGSATCHEDVDGESPLNAKCASGWCSHPEGGAPNYFRTHTHPHNPEVQGQCSVCEKKIVENAGKVSAQEVQAASEILEKIDAHNATNAKPSLEAKEAVAAEEHVRSAQKQLDVAEKDTSATKTKEVIKAKAELDAAKKVAVESEARAELAGKDQRAVEQVQAAAEANADAAETKKSKLYVSTQQLCDRAASTNAPEDKAACDQAKKDYESAESRAQAAIRESEAVSEQAISKADEATKLKVTAALSAEKAGKLPTVAHKKVPKTLTQSIAADVVDSAKALPNETGAGMNSSSATLQEEVRLSRAEAELAEANEKKVALEAKMSTGRPSNKTKAAFAVENGRIAIAEAKAKLEKSKMSNSSAAEKAKAAMEVKVARGQENLAVSEQKLADAMPEQRAAYEKAAKKASLSLDEMRAESREKNADAAVRAAEIKVAAGGTADVDAARREKAAATDAVATTMEKVGEESGDAKMLARAKKEAALAAEQAMMADKLAGASAVETAAKAHKVLETVLQNGTPEQISLAAQRATEADQAVARMEARRSSGNKPTAADIVMKKSLHQKFLKQIVARMKKETGLTPKNQQLLDPLANGTAPANSTQNGTAPETPAQNGTDAMTKLQMVEEEADKRAVELGLAPPQHPPLSDQEVLKHNGVDALARFSKLADSTSNDKNVFSGTLEITGIVCHDWTDEFEGLLGNVLADYIRTSRNNIALKPQCDTQSNVGILPIDFKVVTKSRVEVRQYRASIISCLDNTTCPFVQDFKGKVQRFGVDGTKIVVSLVADQKALVGDEWAVGKLSLSNLKLLFGKPAPARGNGLKEHVEDRMSYARLLGDRVASFSAIADAEAFDTLQMAGFKAKEAAAKVVYERAAKYVQQNLSDVTNVDIIRSAREQLVNATRNMHEVDTEYERLNKSKLEWPSVRDVVEQLEPLSAVLELARGCKIIGNGSDVRATPGCNFHAKQAEAILNSTKNALKEMGGSQESATGKAAEEAQKKFMADFQAIENRRAKRLQKAHDQRIMHANEQKFKRTRAIAQYHKRRQEEDSKRKQKKYQQYLASDSAQNRLFEAVENETDTEAANSVYRSRVDILKMKASEHEEEELEAEKNEAIQEAKRFENSTDPRVLAEKEVYIKKAVKVSEEEKKAISKARYEAEMAKNRASAEMLKAEKQEAENEIADAKKEDSNNMKALMGKASSDSQTGAASDLGSIEGIKERLRTATNPELRIALEAKLAEAAKMEKESPLRRSDVQLGGPEDGISHNGLGRPSLDDMDQVPTTEDYQKRASGDGSIVNVGF